MNRVINRSGSGLGLRNTWRIYLLSKLMDKIRRRFKTTKSDCTIHGWRRFLPNTPKMMIGWKTRRGTRYDWSLIGDWRIQKQKHPNSLLKWISKRLKKGSWTLVSYTGSRKSVITWVRDITLNIPTGKSSRLHFCCNDEKTRPHNIRDRNLEMSVKSNTIPTPYKESNFEAY